MEERNDEAFARRGGKKEERKERICGEWQGNRIERMVLKDKMENKKENLKKKENAMRENAVEQKNSEKMAQKKKGNKEELRKKKKCCKTK